MSKAREVWIQRWFTIGVFILVAFVLVHVALGIKDLRTKFRKVQTRAIALDISVNSLDEKVASLQRQVLPSDPKTTPPKKGCCAKGASRP